MFSPLTNILIKIFAAGFYRAHSGMLVFLFGTIICYCFFINTLGSIHVWEFEDWNLSFTLFLVSDPFILIIFMLVCFAYTLKSLQYCVAQLALKNNEFLYYSSNATNKLQQFKSWFIVQFNILLPLWMYGLFATVIGINYQHYLIPALILIFLFILTGATPLMYLGMVNRLIDIDKQTLFMKLTKGFSKPFFLLYSFYVFNKLKLAYFITKVVSWVFVLGMVSLFSDQKHDAGISAIIMLISVTAHSILIFNDYRFTEVYLYFSHNFPLAKHKLFLGFTANYILLMLPELLWFAMNYNLMETSGVIVFGMSLLLLLRSLLYWFGLNIKRFLFFTFLLFNIFFLVILYKAIWYLLPVNFLIAYLIFAANYSNQSLKY